MQGLRGHRPHHRAYSERRPQPFWSRDAVDDAYKVIPRKALARAGTHLGTAARR